MNANDVPNLSPLTKRGKRRERKNRIEEKKNGEGKSERWELLKEGFMDKICCLCIMAAAERLTTIFLVCFQEVWMTV